MSRKRALQDDDFAGPGLAHSSALGREEEEKLVGMVMRSMLGKHLNKNLISRADVAKIFDEGIRQKRLGGEIFKKARASFKSLLGMELVEVHRKVKRKTTNNMSQTARNVLSQAGFSQSTSSNKHYILVSALPPERRPPPDDMAMVGFVSTVASIVLLDPQFRVEEGSLLRHMETLGATKEGKVHRHPQLGNLNHLLEVELIKNGYFEREADGDLVYLSFGPRLKGEISTDGLVDIVDKVFDGSVDALTRQELELRANGLQEEEEEEEEE